MRVLVCGSRTYSDHAAVHTVLDGLLERSLLSWEPLVIIEGGAKGADQIAREYYSGKEPEDGGYGVYGTHDAVGHATYPAKWTAYGPAAGPRRNQQMLYSSPDEVWAFVDKPLGESRGTADMVGRARAAGIPTHVVQST